MSTPSQTSTDLTRTPVPQLQLPRQVAAPPGPVDARMMYLMHHAFRRDLRLFVEAAAVTSVEDPDTWQALVARWDIFSGALHHHHTGEDAGLWPMLLARADEHERATLDAMEAEHAEIDPSLTACAAGLARMAAAPDPATAARLVEDLRTAQACLHRHLGHEETEAMALVQRYLTTKEWDEMAEEHFGKGQTLRQLTWLVPWALDGVPEGPRADLLQVAGAPMRVLWRLTHRRYDRLDARCRRHLS